ncbi:ectonucleoside triphosphate diphosphohydrolase 1-like isoform X1 [Rhopilema esculentum]|uniref:ectonucleoside triphosphate diphosphohydrolase 1-like isoform X1 n=2 Tax=Rhopilema esculentum TaxID=499914 RepID=UPI0031E2BC98
MVSRALVAAGAIFIVIAVTGLIATNFVNNMESKELVKGRLGIVIDAGGSGTRLSIFELRKDKGMQMIDYIACEDNGLASYERNPEPIKDLLVKCLLKARENVPVETRKTVPLYMEATAGMRILRLKNQTAFDKIWDIVRNSLNQSQFKFKHAGTMTGAKEGITGWGALNYLSSGFKSTKTLGALELGSTSFQVVFQPAKKDFVGGSEIYNFDGHHYKAYVHSYLCYGRSAFEQRYLAKLVVDQNYSSTVKDPCGHQGNRFFKTSDYLWAVPCSSGPYALKTFGSELTGPSGKTYTFTGQSNFTECLSSVGKLIDTTRCNHSSCSFYGVAQPGVHGDFAAFSAFYYPPKDLNMSKTANRSEYESAVKKICSMTASEVRTIPLPPKYRYTYCLSSAYAYKLLTQGIHFNDTTWKITFIRKVNSNSISWSLGYQLMNENEMSQETIHVSRLLSKTEFIGILSACCSFAFLGILILFSVWCRNLRYRI